MVFVADPIKSTISESIGDTCALSRAVFHVESENHIRNFVCAISGFQFWIFGIQKILDSNFTFLESQTSPKQKSDRIFGIYAKNRSRRQLFV